jgi:hypothetical protein
VVIVRPQKTVNFPMLDTALLRRCQVVSPHAVKTRSVTVPVAARGRMWKARRLAAADQSLKRSATQGLLANKRSK